MPLCTKHAISSSISAGVWAAYIIAVPIVGFACREAPCRPLEGQWQTEEGHLWSFHQDRLLWITRFGQLLDTVVLSYRYDCATYPIALDLKELAGGPWRRKTLYGILEWSSDTSFRFCAAAGTDPSLRPRHFTDAETIRFFRAVR